MFLHTFCISENLIIITELDQQVLLNSRSCIFKKMQNEKKSFYESNLYNL